MNGSLRPDLYNVVMAGAIGLAFVFAWNRTVGKKFTGAHT